MANLFLIIGCFYYVLPRHLCETLGYTELNYVRHGEGRKFGWKERVVLKVTKRRYVKVIFWLWSRS